MMKEDLMSKIRGSLILAAVMMALGVGVGMLIDYHNQPDSVMGSEEFCHTATGFMDRCNQ